MMHKHSSDSQPFKNTPYALLMSFIVAHNQNKVIQRFYFKQILSILSKIWRIRRIHPKLNNT